VSSATSNYSTTAIRSGQTTLYIGEDPATAGRNFTGFISDLRIVKGTAVYTAAFAPPTAPLTAIANTQLLTLQHRQPHNNHGFQDSSTNSFLITRSGNATQGTFSPFSPSGWSTLFNGSNGLSVPSNAALSFSGEFTWETFVYFNALPGSGSSASFIMRRSNGASVSSFQFGLNNDTGQYKIFATIAVSSTDYSTNWNISTPSVGRWYHAAVVRDSSFNLHCWLDGVKLALSSGNFNVPGTTNVPGTDVTIGWRNYYNDLYLNGYLSNLRLSAAALYYGQTFTVPTQAFDPNQANTRLLVCHTRRFVDQGSASLTISFNNNPSIQAFSPFTPATYSPAVHGGSVYFDGTGDYLRPATDIQLKLGGDSFTFEFWTYITAVVTGSSLIQFRIPSGYESILLGYSNGSSFRFYATTNSSNWDIASDAGIIAISECLNQWKHWALVRNGSNITVYIDGVSKLSITSSGVIYQATNTFHIGEGMTGYMSGIRHIKQALATSAFTPPISPVTTANIGWSGAGAVSSLSVPVSLLYNFTNAAIFDSTSRTVIETVGDARSSRFITKFAGGSLFFDGTGDYLSIPDNNVFTLGNGDFTIEFWVYPLGSTRQAVLTQTDSSGSNVNASFFIEINASSKWRTAVHSAATDYTIISDASVTTYAWTHIAFVRNNNTGTLYINGTSAGTVSLTGVTVNDSAYPVNISGYGNSGTLPFNGYMQDIRITRGFARYNGNFTPTTVAHKLK
jgi:hypothetical protein